MSQKVRILQSQLLPKVKNMKNEVPVCRGCGRPEAHKLCPAWGTPLYMSGKLFTKEDEEKYAEQRAEALKQARHIGH